MRRIPHRELRSDSDRILAEVAAGETIAVTNNGQIVAVMVPPRLSSLERGRRSGTVVAAGPRLRLSELTRVAARVPLHEVIDDLKAER